MKNRVCIETRNIKIEYESDEEPLDILECRAIEQFKYIQSMKWRAHG